ncbi:hypothetical protein [Nocardia vaccinii]|uniref:hypothetical protein n=1 Tax=Nocardia vaccinii TaxID=1822 RepID=UPI0012F4E584|nr:hypothetical protein [Nocardia vaccinii]
MQNPRSSPARPLYARAQESNTTTGMNYGVTWVRSSLSQLNFLRSTRSVDADAGSAIEFAIRWAPFGGAGHGDLLIAFGVSRRRFVEMLHEGLRARRMDNKEVRWVKGALLAALMSVWRNEAAPQPTRGRR